MREALASPHVRSARRDRGGPRAIRGWSREKGHLPGRRHDYRASWKKRAGQIASGQAGIVGIMLESFLVDGRQELDWTNGMTYGQSVTDSCMGWEMMVPVLYQLAAAVQSRRTRASPGQR